MQHVELTQQQEALYKRALSSARAEIAAAAAAKVPGRGRGRPSKAAQAERAAAAAAAAVEAAQTALAAEDAQAAVLKLSASRINNIFTHLRKASSRGCWLGAALLLRCSWAGLQLGQVAAAPHWPFVVVGLVC